MKLMASNELNDCVIILSFNQISKINIYFTRFEFLIITSSLTLLV